MSTARSRHTAVSIMEARWARPAPRPCPTCFAPPRAAQPDVDAASTPGAPGKRAKTEAATVALSARLSTCRSGCSPRAQRWHRRLLLVLQGMDTSGKGGTVRSTSSAGQTRPACRSPPSRRRPRRSCAHDFLWRIHKAQSRPADRSASSTAATTRTSSSSGCTSSCPRATGERATSSINGFEEQLVDDGHDRREGASCTSRKEEQKARLLARLDDPTKHWKFNPGDVDERRLWDDYAARLRRRDRSAAPTYAPWYVVPADRKWYRDFAVTSLLVEALTAMAPEYPPAGYDVEEQRARVLAT